MKVDITISSVKEKRGEAGSEKDCWDGKKLVMKTTPSTHEKLVLCVFRDNVAQSEIVVDIHELSDALDVYKSLHAKHAVLKNM